MRTLRATWGLVLVGIAATAALLPGTIASAGAKAPVVALAQTPPGCNPNYAGTCVPLNVSDADCAGMGDGPYFVQEKNIVVIGNDLFDLDPDKDGFGCDDPPDGPRGPAPTAAVTTTAPPAATTTTAAPSTTTTAAPSTTTTAAPSTTTTVAAPIDMATTGIATERQVVVALGLVVYGAFFLVVGKRGTKFGMG